MRYSQAEALRYMRAPATDKATANLLDLVYLKLRNEVQARSVIRRFTCQVDEGGVLLDCGIRFHSQSLARHLRGCQEVLLLAATLGSRVDIAIRRLTLGSVTEGAAAQAVAAAVIEGYCDEVQSAYATELHQKPRFSPGYGDWPLEEQEQIFRLLDCPKQIGLTLTEGLMMVPSKSVTAIIGLTAEETCVQQKCKTCVNTACPYREGNI